WMLILLEYKSSFSFFYFNWNDFICKATCFNCSFCSLLTFHCKCILIFSRDLVLICYFFRGDTHPQIFPINFFRLLTSFCIRSNQCRCSSSEAHISKVKRAASHPLRTSSNDTI